MKKKWKAGCVVSAFILSACTAFWMERPMLTQMLGDTIATTANSKLNGTLSFASLDVSLSGTVRIDRPVIRDANGHVVLESDDICVYVNPVKLLPAIRTGEVVDALDTVAVDKPILHIWQNSQDETWNIQSLVKESNESSTSSFHGAIQIHEGTVRAALANGTTLCADHTEGTISFANYPGHIQVTVDSKLDGKDISISGRYTSTRNYSFMVKADSIQTIYGNALIPSTMDVSVTGGTMENVRAKIADGHDGFMLAGQGDIKNGAARAYGYAVQDIQGHVELTSDDVTLQHVTGKVNDQEVSLDGVIKTNTNTPVFNVAVKAPSISLDAFADVLPVALSGTVGINGTLWGTKDDVNGKGTVSLSTIDYDGWHIDEGTADIVCANQLFQLEKVQLQAAGGTISGTGQYDLQHQSYAASLQAENIDLSQIPAIPANVLGTVAGDIHIQGQGTAMDGVQATGHVRGEDLSYDGLMISQLAGDMTLSNQIVSLANLTGSVGSGVISAGGTYDIKANTPNLSFSVTDLPIDMFSSYVSVPMDGIVSASGHVYGADWQWDAVFNGKNGSIKGLAFDTIDGSLSGVGQRIEFPGVYWRYVDGTHTLSGWVDLEKRTVDATMVTSHMRVEKLLPVINQESLPFTGWADNTIHVGGTLDNPTATGSFQLTEGSYGGYLYKKVGADYRLEDGTVFISNGEIAWLNASLTINGSVGKTIDINIEGNQLDIARMAPWSKASRSGNFNLTAHVGGTIDKPTASGSIQSAYLVFNHMPITDVRGSFTYSDNMVRLTDLHFTQRNGQYDANLLYRLNDKWVRGKATVKSGDVGSLLKLVNAPVEQVEGQIDGTISVQGTSDNPIASVNGTLSNVSLAGKTFNPAAIDMTYENNTVAIKKLELTSDDSIFAIDGSYTIHGPVQLQMAAKNFPTKNLLAIMGQKSIDVDAPLTVMAEFTGTSDNMGANISAELQAGTINGVTFTNAYGMLNIKDGHIYIDQAYAAKDPYKIIAYGDIPMSALQGARSGESMDVTVKLDNAGLDALTFLTPAVTAAEGGIEGALHLKGTLDMPQVEGNIGVTDGTIRFKGVSNPLEHITGNIAFDGTSVQLNGSATMDKKGAKDAGTISVAGNASWNGWNLVSYNGTMDIDHLGVMCDYYKGPLNGHIYVEPGKAAPKIGGEVMVDNAVIDAPLSFSDSDSQLPLELDLTVTLDDKVRLYNSALYDLMVHGSVNFKGTLSNPHASGRFETTRGTVHYLDTNFRVLNARADFTQPNSFLPVVNAEGITKVGQYNVLLTLRGPADSMDMILRSNPPLTKQQIVSLITLRNSSSKQQSTSIGGDDMNSLLGSGLRMTLNSLGITQQLENFLSLDMVTVTNGSLNLNDKNTDLSKNYYNIEMGKYLFDDFMVTAAFGLNHDDNRFGVQYELGTKFNLNAWKSDDEKYIGGAYKYSF